MKIEHIQTIYGPNNFNKSSVILMSLTRDGLPVVDVNEVLTTALEFARLAGIGVDFSRVIENRIIVGFQNEYAMRYLLASAVKFCEAVSRGEKYDVGPVVREAREIVTGSESDIRHPH